MSTPENTAKSAASAYLHMKEVYELHASAYESLGFETTKPFAVSFDGSTMVI